MVTANGNAAPAAPEAAAEATSRRRLYAYMAISALVSFSIWALLLLPNFLHAFGWSSWKVGWAIGCYFIVNLVFQILAGPLADRYGNVPTALWGATIGFAGGLLYLAAGNSPAWIFPARILHAAGVALIFSGALLQLLRSVPNHLRGRMMGYFGLPGFVMMGLGPPVAEWFVYAWGFEGLFLLVCVTFGAIAMILLELSRPLVPRGTRRHSFLPAFRASFSVLWRILAFSVCFGLGFAAWNGFLAPAVSALGAGGVSAFGLGYGLGAVLTRLGVSHLVDTGSNRRAGIATLLAYSLSLAFIPLAQHIWQLAFLGLVCGMAHGIYYPSLSSLATERFPPLHEGQALSLYISASAFGMFVGPPLWGAMADRTGYPVMFAAAGTVLGVATLVFIVRGIRR